MKRILYILAALLLLVSCGEKNGGKTELTLEQKLCTEWHSTFLPVDGDIYISFREDKTFELYQQIGQGAHRLYRGTWNLEETLLTGKYNDGEAWAAAYEIIINDKQLTMTSVNDAAEESVFAREDIPQEVIQTCETVVKSH
ncbi:MAG: lipocalin family protein [Bacteroidales bacterium]|nr:lipocalin family protein [Bacteroidales bacterium]